MAVAAEAAEPSPRRASEASVSASVSSASSTATSPATLAERDVETQQPYTTKVSYFRRIIDQTGVTDDVLQHKYAGHGTEGSPYLVEFLPNDPWNPMTFPRSYKWLITIVQAVATLSVTFASSAFTGGIIDIMTEFKVSSEVATLGISMFVLGFAVGPLFWAPFSEMFGRQRLFFFTYIGTVAFNAAAAGAPNIEAMIILRFFGGAFGSSPLTNAGGVIADMFTAAERGVATSIFAMAPFLGPAIGPIAGGFLGESTSWRWVQGMITIFCGVLWILSTVTYPETYTPILLERRAAALSKRTGKTYESKLNAGGPHLTLGGKLKVALSRPWILLFMEPIVLLTSIYMAIIYGTLYLCFAAFPIVFQQGRGWSPGIGGLAFIGLAVGMTLTVIGTIFDNKRYARVADKHNGNAPPEARLPPAMLGSILIPVGMFWFAWTNGKDVHWAVPIVGSGVFGGGIVLVFLSMLNYMVDAYVIYAASVLAANSVLRSLFGAAFPLFTRYMYDGLGIHWASSVPAFLAVACVPFPFLFYYYGHRIRQKCKYAAEAAAFVERMRKGGGQQTDEDMLEAELQRTRSSAHPM